MPELPDVEGFRRVLAEHGRGRRIREVLVHDRGVLRDVAPERFADALTGRTFGEPQRVGKWLLAPVDDGTTVVLHFGMTGGLLWCEPGADRHRHDRVVFRFGFDEGELRYRDMRKLTGLRLARDRTEVDAVLDGEGPDALDVGRAEFNELLGRRRRRLKSALMDQHTIGGLGNLLVDEILWRARQPPDRRGPDLDRDERRRLHTEMRRVLRDSIKAERVPDRRGWLTGARDRSDPQCPRCGTRLRKERVAGRATVWCPHCQASR